MMKTCIAYIGLGSNLTQPYQQIKNAIAALNALADTRVSADSGYYKSRPMGPENQPDYINAVVELETDYDVVELLHHCQHIEKQQNRVKTRHWGERTIDLDILLYASQQVNTEDLTVPHPGICQRDFVYMPLLKLKPDIEVPGEGRLSDMVNLQSGQHIGYSCQFAGDISR